MRPFNLSLGWDSVWDSTDSFTGSELSSSTRSMRGIPRQAAEAADFCLAKALLGLPLPESPAQAPQLGLFCMPRTLGGSDQPGCLGHSHPKRVEMQMCPALILMGVAILCLHLAQERV